MSTKAIAQDASRHFDLNFATKAEFQVFQQYSVLSQVKRLRNQGLVEVAYCEGKPQHKGIWIWKNELPTFAELTALVAAVV